MKKFLVATTLALFLVPAVADDISVNEFVPGTIISSADMNQNFDTLVEESNENDSRITALENAEAPVASAGGVSAVWVDGTGEVLGYAIGYDSENVYAMIPESNLMFGVVYQIRDPNPNMYGGGGVLYSLPGCKGQIALQVYSYLSNIQEDGFRAVSWGVDVDGYYVYPPEPVQRIEGNFYYQSRSKVDQYTGEISCEKNVSDAVPAYLAATSSKRYHAPVVSPVLPRRQ